MAEKEAAVPQATVVEDAETAEIKSITEEAKPETETKINEGGVEPSATTGG